MDSRSNFNNPVLTMLVLAILVKRLGGSVEVTQADVDDVAFNRLDEDSHGDGSFTLRLVERRLAG